MKPVPKSGKGNKFYYLNYQQQPFLCHVNGIARGPPKGCHFRNTKQIFKDIPPHRLLSDQKDKPLEDIITSHSIKIPKNDI